jgi:hypothetical protein
MFLISQRKDKHKTYIEGFVINDRAFYYGLYSNNSKKQKKAGACMSTNDIKKVELYIFRNSINPNRKLYLYRGVDENQKISISHHKGYWLIKSLYSPFPIHCDTWFEGFRPDVMKGYLKTMHYDFVECVAL